MLLIVRRTLKQVRILFDQSEMNPLLGSIGETVAYLRQPPPPPRALSPGIIADLSCLMSLRTHPWTHCDGVWFGQADRIRSIHNMGALSLNTSSLKSQLKRECSAWKTKYCQNLHRQAKDSLESLTEYMRVRGTGMCSFCHVLFVGIKTTKHHLASPSCRISNAS